MRKIIKNNKLLTKISNTVNYIGYSYNERYKNFLIYYINEINLNKSTEVLILLHDINLSRQATLKKELEYNFNNINFDIEYNFFKYKNSNKKYDYIIDDLDINLGSGDIFNRIKNKLLSLIIEKNLQSYQNK